MNAELAKASEERIAEAKAEGGDDDDRISKDSRKLKFSDRMKLVVSNKEEATELFKGKNYAHAAQVQPRPPSIFLSLSLPLSLSLSLFALLN